MKFEDLRPGDFQATSVDGGLAKLVRIWEHLRDLNTGGYGGAVLVDVKNATSKGKSGVTSCSPFTATCIYMALDPRPFDPGQPWSLKEPYEPQFDGGKPLDATFYGLHNGFSLSYFAALNANKKFAAWKGAFKKNYVDRMPQLAGDFGAFEYIAHSAGSVVALNLGKPVEPRKMRRGDVVGIDWQSGNGHATFCWNVHLNKNGEVDCFQFISSNGTAAGGAGITLFRYPDVDPKYMERSGGKYLKKKEMFAGIIEDPKAYPEYIEKPYWWFGLPGFKKGDIDLDTFGVPAKNVQISYAGSMPVSLAVCHVSRLGGVVPPEPYLRADGGKTPEPAADEAPKPIKAKAKKSEEAKEPEKAPPPAESHPAHDEAEDNLGVLWKARWISTDPADPKAAMRDFQSKYMGGNVPQPGHPDPKTREKIARYAAWATNQAQVHAGLSIAFHRGELKVAPGDNPAQLDDATIAAVKAFQKQKGLGVDGIPGHDTQAALASYMKEAAQSQSAPEPDQPAAKSDDKPAAKPQIKSLYFVRNNGPAGKKATLKATTEGCDGKSCSVSLVKDGKTLVADAGKISFDSGVGILELSIPEGLTLGAKVFAQLGGELSAETKSPFLVLDTVDLPPILAGPIVRRAEPGQVWFWLATSVQVDGVTAKISQMEGGGGFGVPVESAYKSVRLGERLWVTLVSAKPNSGTFPLDKILDYDIALTYDTGTSSKEVKISEEEGLSYAPYKRPTFVIASKNSRVAHGSCRRPGASGTDAYPSLDRWLTSAASDPAKRVAALFLTGDQIYADDVARSLFQSVRSLSKHLMGFDETLQLDGSHTSTSAANMVFTDPDDKKKPPPGSRRDIILRHGFTTEDAQGHLITFGEFAAMYLLVCNPKLCEKYDLEGHLSDDERTYDPSLRGFTQAVATTRRVLANVATYMVFDDHEITDDWNISADWVHNTQKPENFFGRRLLANALAAYWAFQGWGNDPEAGSKPDLGFVVGTHLEALRKGAGKPYAEGGERFDTPLLRYHSWSYVAPTHPPVLVADERTSREFGDRATLIGQSELERMKQLGAKAFKSGEPLVLVLQTPILPWQPGAKMIQGKPMKPEYDRGDFWFDVPDGRADFLAWVQRTFAPSYCAIMSGDVHHGFVVKGASWVTEKKITTTSDLILAVSSAASEVQLKIVQITSSPIKNEKDELNWSVLRVIKDQFDSKWAKKGIEIGIDLLSPALSLGSDSISGAEAGNIILSTSAMDQRKLAGGKFLNLIYSALLLDGASARTVVEKNHFSVVDFRTPNEVGIEYYGQEANAQVKVPV